MTTGEALSPALHAFVRDMVASGRYGSAAEVVAEGLRLLRDREAGRTAALERDRSGEAWRLGGESGDPVDADEVFDRLVARYDRLAKAGGV